MSAVRLSDYEPVTAFFKALANPVRAAIVDLLSRQEYTVSQLVDQLGLAQPLISQHLRILRNAHLVATRRRGQEIWYRICDQHVAHVVSDAIKHTEELT